MAALEQKGGKTVFFKAFWSNPYVRKRFQKTTFAFSKKDLPQIVAIKPSEIQEMLYEGKVEDLTVDKVGDFLS